MTLSGKNSEEQSSELQQNMEMLRQIYFFSGLPLETLKLFAYLCTREKFKAGEYLFQQGEDDGQAFYIIEGKASLERQDNGKTAMIREYAAGDFVGGLTLLSDMHRIYLLKSVADTTCLILNREKFAKVMEQFPEAMPKVFKAVAQNINNWEERFLSNRGDQCGDCMGQLGVSLI